MTTVLNATGHVVRIRNADGGLTTYPPTTLCFRVTGAEVRDWNVATDIGADIVQRRCYYSFTDLPPYDPDTIYIVSRRFAYAYASIRDDFVYPDTECGAERDKNGRVYAVRRFRRPDLMVVQDQP